MKPKNVYHGVPFLDDIKYNFVNEGSDVESVNGNELLNPSQLKQHLEAFRHPILTGRLVD